MKLYTKRGDDGSTGLIGTSRVPKNHPRVMAYGEVDETNAAVGWAIAAWRDERWAERLRAIQSDLFVLGAELATPSGQTPSQRIGEDLITQLERWIDEASEAVAPLRNFVLPGGTELSGRLHLARTICRRAERAVVQLGQEEAVRGEAVIYLNRLSDLLFAMARLANHQAGVPDVPWKAPA
jgi:cob(I)alamin adenosyltransferase